jgi:hypothetical protein
MSNIAVIETDAVVASMNRARLALSEAKTIQQTKLIVDTAAAAEIYARRQKLGEEASNLALSIKIEALRKLGGMLEQTPRASGVKKAGTVLGGSKVELPKNDAPTLAELGLTKKESALAQKLNTLPEEDYQQVRDGNISVAKAIAAVDAGKTKAKSKPKAKTGTKSAPASAAPAPLHAVAPTGDVTNDADTGQSLDELIAEIQKENEQLHAQLKAMEADDTKAELRKALLQRDHAIRQQSEAMDKAHKSQDREKWAKRQLMRCGKAVGEEDPDKIAAAVEAFIRQYRKAA